MTTWKVVLTFGVVVAALTACQGSDRATKAATVSNAIAAKPAAADSILKANGYTAESYQATMYEIAKDSAESARYAAALRQ